MKRICLSICFIVWCLSTLAACSRRDITKYHYFYTGENELWSANYQDDYQVEFTKEDGVLHAESESASLLVVEYQGELKDLSSVRHMEIAYESAFSGGKLVSDYDDGESISSTTFTLSSSSKNSAAPIENDIIEVTINIDGELQTLELVTKD